MGDLLDTVERPQRVENLDLRERQAACERVEESWVSRERLGVNFCGCRNPAAPRADEGKDMRATLVQRAQALPDDLEPLRCFVDRNSPTQVDSKHVRPPSLPHRPEAWKDTLHE